MSTSKPVTPTTSTTPLAAPLKSDAPARTGTITTPADGAKHIVTAPPSSSRETSGIYSPAERSTTVRDAGLQALSQSTPTSAPISTPPKPESIEGLRARAKELREHSLGRSHDTGWKSETGTKSLGQLAQKMASDLEEKANQLEEIKKNFEATAAKINDTVPAMKKEIQGINAQIRELSTRPGAKSHLMIEPLKERATRLTQEINKLESEAQSLTTKRRQMEAHVNQPIKKPHSAEEIIEEQKKGLAGRPPSEATQAQKPQTDEKLSELGMGQLQEEADALKEHNAPAHEDMEKMPTSPDGKSPDLQRIHIQPKRLMDIPETPQFAALRQSAQKADDVAKSRLTKFINIFRGGYQAEKEHKASVLREALNIVSQLNSKRNIPHKIGKSRDFIIKNINIILNAMDTEESKKLTSHLQLSKKIGSNIKSSNIYELYNELSKDPTKTLLANPNNLEIIKALLTDDGQRTKFDALMNWISKKGGAEHPKAAEYLNRIIQKGEQCGYQDKEFSTLNTEGNDLSSIARQNAVQLSHALVDGYAVIEAFVDKDTLLKAQENLTKNRVYGAIILFARQPVQNYAVLAQKLQNTPFFPNKTGNINKLIDCVSELADTTSKAHEMIMNQAPAFNPLKLRKALDKIKSEEALKAEEEREKHKEVKPKEK